MNRNVRIAKELVRLAKSLVAQQNEEQAINDAVEEINKIVEQGKTASARGNYSITASRRIVAQSKLMNILLTLALMFGMSSATMAMERSSMNEEETKQMTKAVQMEVKKAEDLKWNVDDIEIDNGQKTVIVSYKTALSGIPIQGEITFEKESRETFKLPEAWLTARKCIIKIGQHSLAYEVGTSNMIILRTGNEKYTEEPYIMKPLELLRSHQNDFVEAAQNCFGNALRGNSVTVKPMQ